MSALTMAELSGLGQAEIIAAIAGPLVTGGADVYRTYSEQKQTKAELRQREKEFKGLLPVIKQQSESQERQAALAAIAAIRQTQAEARAQAEGTPYLFGAVALGGLALVAIAALSKRGRHGR